jgi:hypothetical protein
VTFWPPTNNPFYNPLFYKQRKYPFFSTNLIIKKQLKQAIFQSNNFSFVFHYSFESSRAHHVAASGLPFAAIFLKSPRAHLAAAPFQIEPASPDFDLVSGANL